MIYDAKTWNMQILTHNPIIESWNCFSDDRPCCSEISKNLGKAVGDKGGVKTRQLPEPTPRCVLTDTVQRVRSIQETPRPGHIL